jgi:hypothetical protein
MELDRDTFVGPPSRDQRAASHVIAPVSMISKWAGHYDAAFTMKTYVRTSDGDLGKAPRRSTVST